jgi:hypothetical protein
MGSSDRGARIVGTPEDPEGVVLRRAKWGEGAEIAFVGRRLRR